jgi:hypothetical protein
MTALKTPRARFVCGFVGGLCIYLAKLAVVTSSGAITLGAGVPTIGYPYMFGILATAVLGGIVSYALESHNVLIGLYHGATAPAFFAFLSHASK